MLIRRCLDIFVFVVASGLHCFYLLIKQIPTPLFPIQLTVLPGQLGFALWSAAFSLVYHNNLSAYLWPKWCSVAFLFYKIMIQLIPNFQRDNREQASNFCTPLFVAVVSGESAYYVIPQTQEVTMSTDLKKDLAECWKRDWVIAIHPISRMTVWNGGQSISPFKPGLSILSTLGLLDL